MASIQKYRESEVFKALMVHAAEEQLFVTPPDVKIIKPCGGFAGR